MSVAWTWPGCWPDCMAESHSVANAAAIIMLLSL